MAAILTIFIGNIVVLIPMILNGHASAKYGIPFLFLPGPVWYYRRQYPAILRPLLPVDGLAFKHGSMGSLFQMAGIVSIF